LDELKKKRFLWGVALRLGTIGSGADRAQQCGQRHVKRATGLAAVAGGLAEMFAVCVIGAILKQSQSS
jgi:hypothetical protein